MKLCLVLADRVLSRQSHGSILLFSTVAVGAIGAVDYITGYSISLSEFYLGPVAMAAWYAGGPVSAAVAMLATVSWLMADIASGLQDQHPGITVWNTLIRFAFFLIGAFLTARLRISLVLQRSLARTDTLTGAYNRRAFDERLDHDLDLARRNGSRLTLAFIDVDHFKNLNDTYGHATGDQALRVIATVLLKATRRSDTVARLGGDEFALVLPSINGAEAQDMMARLRPDLQLALEPIASELTCSIGVVTFEVMPEDASDAVHTADSLMYEAKQRGRNGVTFKVIVAGTN